MEHLEGPLMARAYLYTDPQSYREGVLAALAAVQSMLAEAPTMGDPAGGDALSVAIRGVPTARP